MVTDSKMGVSARVIVDEPTGAETLIALDLTGDSLQITLRDRVAVTANQMLNLNFPHHLLHLLVPLAEYASPI